MPESISPHDSVSQCGDGDSNCVCERYTGYVYRIRCVDGLDNRVYVGSTRNFGARRSRHKQLVSRQPPESKGELALYPYIRANGGWSNFAFELLETISFKKSDKFSLFGRERYWIGQQIAGAVLNRISPPKAAAAAAADAIAER